MGGGAKSLLILVEKFLSCTFGQNPSLILTEEKSTYIFGQSPSLYEVSLLVRHMSVKTELVK